MKSSRRWKKSSPKPKHLHKIEVYGAPLLGHTVYYIPIILRNDVLKPPASFLFHSEFVICLFAFLYDKSVFKGGFIK